MKTYIASIQDQIADKLTRPMTLMEVCGSHSMAMAEHGIRSMLPPEVKVLSGPGCPVCVTDASELYHAIQLAKRDDVIVATFGDMLKVPCFGESLQDFSNVEVIYSPLETVQLAKENPSKKVVLLGVGFETTAPLIAFAVLEATKQGLDNFFVLPMHKLVPPALEAIFADPDIALDGLILPGHVSVVMGSEYFDFVPKLGISGVISGFAANDLMSSVSLLVDLVQSGETKVINNYKSVVTANGNDVAKATMMTVYEVADSPWRKVGTIPDSGLRLREKFRRFDAVEHFDLQAVKRREPGGCLCGDIMMGKKQPRDCRLFAKSCRPATPIGPCMVSSEGSCAAVYKYEM